MCVIVDGLRPRVASSLMPTAAIPDMTDAAPGRDPMEAMRTSSAMKRFQASHTASSMTSQSAKTWWSHAGTGRVAPATGDGGLGIPAALRLDQ